MRLPTLLFLLLPGATLELSTAVAATIHVPADYASIREAIEHAVSGDLILVAPGYYVERIDFGGKSLRVISEGGAAATTIDGLHGGSVVTFDDHEDAATLLEGFTIKKGWGKTIGDLSAGGGIFCLSSPTIRSCVISNNVAHYENGTLGSARGGGVYFGPNSGARLIDCTITNNVTDDVYFTGESYGGGLYVASGGVVIENCLVNNNTTERGGGGIFCSVGTTGVPRIVGCTVSGNVADYGAGMAFVQSTVGLGGSVRRCLVNANVGSALHFSGSGLAGIQLQSTLIAGNVGLGVVADATATSVSLENCTLVENSGGIDSAGLVTVTNSILWDNGTELTGLVQLRYSDVAGGAPGTGNIDADPLFTGAQNGDYRLQAGSPCIDAGDPAFVPGPGGERDLARNSRLLDGDLLGAMIADMGAYEHANIRLDIAGPATPGSALVLTTSGKPGLPNVMLLGFGETAVLVNPFGYLFVGPFLAFPWIPAPSTVSLYIPADLPTPFLLVFQEAAFEGGFLGNLSNGVAIVIR